MGENGAFRLLIAFMSVCVSAPKLTTECVFLCACVMEEVGKLWLEQEGISSEAFSVGCEDLITFMSTQVKPAGPHSAPHPRLGPGPVCLWYAVHVARPQQKGPLLANVVLQRAAPASDNTSAAHSRSNQIKGPSYLLRNVRGADDPLNNRIVMG